MHRYLSYIHKLTTDAAEEEANKEQPQHSGEGQQTDLPQAAQQQSQHAEEVRRTDPVEAAQKQCIQHQIGRIRTSVESAVRYLAKALLEPPLVGKTNTPMMPDHKVPGESNYYYVLTTIWYVLRYFQETDPDWKFGKSQFLSGLFPLSCYFGFCLYINVPQLLEHSTLRHLRHKCKKYTDSEILGNRLGRLVTHERYQLDVTHTSPPSS